MNRRRPGQLRDVLQGRPIRPPRADLRPDRRPPGLAEGGARRDGRRLAPLAEGLEARGPRGVRAAAGLVAGAAPEPGPVVEPDEGARPRGRGHPRRPGQAPGDPAPGAAPHPPDRAAPGGDLPRGRHLPRHCRARSCRPRPRSSRSTATSSRPASARCSRGSAPRSKRCAGRDRRSSPGPAPPAAARTRRSAPPSPSLPWSSPARWSRTRPGCGPASTPRACSRVRSRARRRPAGPSPRCQQLTPEALLTADQVGAALGGTWTQGQTSNNTDGDGLVFTCQGGRYADPAGVGRAGADVQGGRRAQRQGRSRAPPGSPPRSPPTRTAGRDDVRDDRGLVRRVHVAPDAAADDPQGQGRRRRGDALHAPGLERAGAGPGRRRRAHGRRHDHDLPHPSRTRSHPDPAAERRPCWPAPSTASAACRPAAPAPTPRSSRPCRRWRPGRRPRCSARSTCRRSRR